MLIWKQLSSFDNFWVSKLRVTFLKLFVEEYRKIELVGRSVTRPLFNIRGKPTLFQNLRAKLRADFLTF